VALSCTTHTAELFDRGGRKKIGSLGPLSRVKWERRRDDISVAQVWIATVDKTCSEVLRLAETNRTELVIFRGTKRVWEGPVNRIAYQGSSVEIEAKDMMYYVQRTIMRNEYDNRYPNVGLVLDRIDRVMTAELARKEALDPSSNLLNHVRYIYASGGSTDARTAAHTLPYEMTVFQHIDNYAWRGGIDYTVVGRSIMFFDVHTRIGQTPMVTADDFIGDPIITQYGAELTTYVAMTDGKGHFGAAGYAASTGKPFGVDPYYGEWEVLHQAYDENASTPNPEDDNEPSVAEMTSQARRSYVQGMRPALVVRIPDNTRLNPNGVLTIEDLVPGVWIPLTASLPGRTISQMQKLDNMTVEETGENGEEIKVTLSPAYPERYVEEAVEL
jgi:hypothetical protein